MISVRSLLTGLSTLFFPPICVGCDRRFEKVKSVVCNDCWQKIKLLSPEITNNKVVPEFLTGIFPVFLFDDLVQRIIHALKYSGYRSLGIDLGEQSAAYFPFKINPELTILSPIPLHPSKRRERGYNQSEYIARGIANKLGTAVRADLLKRVKNTRTQTQLDAHERQDNMRSAFSMNEKYSLAGVESVVLIDDVFTTGATLNSAAEVLKTNGISNIFGFTVAAPV